MIDVDKPMQTIQASAGTRTSTTWGHGSCVVELVSSGGGV